MNEAVIVGGARTPIGAFLGSLSSLSAPSLGGHAIKAALLRSSISASDVDEVLMGCVLTGGLGQAPARQAMFAAGLPNSVPATTVNKVCGSGMKTVMLAAQSIRLGDASIVVAGGMESMSNAAFALDRARTGYRMGNGKLIDLMIHDGLWDPYDNCHMGSCGDATALEEGFSREELDEFARQSYERALAAQYSGVLADEIIPVPVPQRKGEPILITSDEEPVKGDPTRIGTLKPVFSDNGVTTAGNASSINDGAAALVLASIEVARSRGLNLLGKIAGYSSYAQQPTRFTTAPAHAIQKLLKAQNLTVNDIDLFEVNEAFAVVALAVSRRVGIPYDRLNVNGGAVALGHPIGMTGTRLILTATLELRRRGGKFAIATPCIGGGEATAVLIESIE